MFTINVEIPALQAFVDLVREIRNDQEKINEQVLLLKTAVDKLEAAVQRGNQ